MQGLLVVFAPIALVFFTLAMERVEAHLRKLTVQQDEVQDFIDTHAPEDPLAPPVADPLEASAPTTPRPHAADHGEPWSQTLRNPRSGT